VASNRVYTDTNGQKVKETSWFRVSVWWQQAENANNYLQKGSMVLIEGELRPIVKPATRAPSPAKTGRPAHLRGLCPHLRFLSPTQRRRQRGMRGRRPRNERRGHSLLISRFVNHNDIFRYVI
jgi:hypothetical protein